MRDVCINTLVANIVHTTLPYTSVEACSIIYKPVSHGCVPLFAYIVNTNLYYIKLFSKYLFIVSGLCQIPRIKHGAVVGNIAARVVTRGYQARVECYPAHAISRDVPVTCMGDTWTDIPTCHLGNYCSI